MAPTLGWIIVIVLVTNKISFTSSISVKVGNFQYLHRHPKLKSCADEVLKENRYVGGRVHMLTGECEGLDRSWLFNQTVQSGYAYTKKLSIQESFLPPLEYSYSSGIVWTIPVLLREGVTVAVEVEQDKRAFGIYIQLVDRVKGSALTIEYKRPDLPHALESHIEDERRLQLQDILCAGDECRETGIINRRAQQIDISSMSNIKFQKLGYLCPEQMSCPLFITKELKWYWTYKTYTLSECNPPQITKEMKHKISFKAHTGSLELLLDDHKICAFTPRFADPTAYSEIHVYEGRLHGVEIIDA